MTDPPFLLEIRDNGPGMTPAQQEHLFEPFNRLGRAESATGGAGIGLALPRRRVMAISAAPAVASTAGQGSCFRLDFPAAADVP